MKDPIGYIKKPDTLVVVIGETESSAADALLNAAKAIGAEEADTSTTLPGEHAFSKVAVFELEGPRKPRARREDSDEEGGHAGHGAEVAQKGARNFFRPRPPAGKDAPEAAPPPGASSPPTTDYDRLLSRE